MNNYVFQDIVCGKEGLLKGPFGSDLKRSLYVEKTNSAYKVYLQENILDETLDAGDHYISKEYYESKMSRYAVKENDFIVTCDGTLGEIYQLKGIKEKGIISSSLLRITLNPQIVDYDYFYYLFKFLIKKELIIQANNSVLKHLPGIEIIRKHPISLPDMNVQKKIGAILASIDAQIKRNNEMVQKLQVLSHNIFQFYYSKNDKKKVKLKDIATMYQPETITGNDFVSNGKYYVYGSGGIIGKYNKYNHKDSELMISCRGKCGNIALSLPFSWIIGNQMIVKPHQIQLKYYLYNYFKIINLYKIETGSVQKQITRSNLEKLEIHLLNENILLNLANKLQPIYKQIIEITINNEKLNEIKEKLLPLLINQQLIWTKILSKK